MKKHISLLAGMLALVMAFSACGASKPQTVHIATKPMTEQFVLGEMLSMLIEKETGATVEITKGVGGGTANIQIALEKGDFDLYPEYTGTGWQIVLKETDILPDAELYPKLVAGYEEKLNLTWVGRYGFNNTYTLMVRKEVAEKYNLKTFSDLAAVSGELVFGANADFYEREDGFNALSQAYGFQFKKTADIDIGLKYTAIQSGDIDVTTAFTTDAQLSVAPVVVLEDDKNYFQEYFAGTVVRQDTLKEVPKLKDALMKMENLITDKEMAAMSYEVEVNGKDERVVAEDFLKSKGLL